jgi:hypothetical protein
MHEQFVEAFVQGIVCDKKHPCAIDVSAPRTVELAMHKNRGGACLSFSIIFLFYGLPATQ